MKLTNANRLFYGGLVLIICMAITRFMMWLSEDVTTLRLILPFSLLIVLFMYLVGIILEMIYKSIEKELFK